MYTVKQFGKTSCSALPWPDLAPRADETPDQIIDLTKALINDTGGGVGREDEGGGKKEKLSQSFFLFFFFICALLSRRGMKSSEPVDKATAAEGDVH